MKAVDKRIDEGVLKWFGHVKKMGNNSIAKKVYWINTVKDCLKKSLNARGL